MSSDNSTKHGGRGRFRRYAPLLIWTGVIFLLSSGQASMSETSRFIRPLLEFLFPSAPDETIYRALVLIRKFAHVTEYAALAFFAARAFFTSSIVLFQRFWFAASILLVAIIASFDELQQAFTSSRTGSGWDVLIDLFGGTAMIVIILLFKAKWPLAGIFTRPLIY